MNKTLLSLAILISASTFAQMQVNALSLTTNDIVYDANSNRIYATIPSANGSNGNSIGKINPDTYLLENTVFIGSEPKAMAITDDGQYIYTGFSGTSTARRFNVLTQTAEIQFSLGTDSSTGPNYVEDIEVMPGQPNSIAVSRRNNGFTPRHEGVVIYDDGIARATTTQDHTGSNKIEFKNSTTMFGYNNETTEFGLRRLSVNSGGVSEVSVSNNMPSSYNFALDFVYNSDKLYYTDGSVIDVSGSPFLIGKFANVQGPVVYDNYNDLVCFASYDYSGNIVFKRYNPNTFLLHDNLAITQAFGKVESIILCGNGCYAFNTADNNVVIIKNGSLGLNTFAPKSLISIYPNPTSDYVKINSENDQKIIQAQIFDLNGRLLSNSDIANQMVDFKNLTKGMYILKLIDENNSIHFEKVIKK